MLHLDVGNVHIPKEQKFWLRSTVCCQRINGTWLIPSEQSAAQSPKKKAGNPPAFFNHAVRFA